MINAILTIILINFNICHHIKCIERVRIFLTSFVIVIFKVNGHHTRYQKMDAITRLKQRLHENIAESTR